MEHKKYQSVKDLISLVKDTFPNEKKIVRMFENCYCNTLNTTLTKLPDGLVHVITGDIDAMWLRDSTAQVRPYIIPAKNDTALSDLLVGVSKRQFYLLNQIDLYANAFNMSANNKCWKEDVPRQHPHVWEEKYELDSLCYPIQLAYLIWKNCGRRDVFGQDFIEAAKKIMDQIVVEQDHEHRSTYRFQRPNTYFTDTLSRNGKGALVKSEIGMSWSGFRPSDDACVYGYLVPSNMFAVVVLNYLSEIYTEVFFDEANAIRAKLLAQQIQSSIETYGRTRTEVYGEVYAYETDGFGQYLLMDDANVPSLLAMKYLGYIPESEEVYENTQRLILSEMNPYYYKGKAASGIGSMHTPPRYIWHISLAIQGLIARTKEDKMKFLNQLIATDGGKELLHEGFLADDPSVYTREWFSWANAMFCELVLDYCGKQIVK